MIATELHHGSRCAAAVRALALAVIVPGDRGAPVAAADALQGWSRCANLCPMTAKMRLLRDEDLRELLVVRGIRVTEQRMALLRELARLRVPASHPELTERLAGTALDRATIYRNLVSLTEAGLLVRTQLGDNVWRYEMPGDAAPEHGRHAHFVCTDCGDVACLSEGDVALRGAAARNEVSEVQLRGRCVSCVRT